MVAIIVVLVLMSATFSGLTIGMFSLSLSGLERKIRMGDKKAERVYAIRKNGNFLLCTLLLGNTAINTALTVCLNEIASGVVASIASTIIIFVFGEVTPQAIFSRFAYEVGYRTSWLVKIFMILMWPIAKPMSMALDFLLGKEFPETYDKQELQEVVAEHRGNAIDSDEHRIIMGAMKYSEKTAKEVLTPVTIVYNLDESIIVSQTLLEQIRKQHYSRIPVYSGSRDKVVGILYAKDLIGYEITSNKTVGEMSRKEDILCIRSNMHLDSLMNHFIKNKTHMAFVYNEFSVLLGIVTLEDIVEEVLAVEILDESDTIADLQSLAKRAGQLNISLQDNE